MIQENTFLKHVNSCLLVLIILSMVFNVALKDEPTIIIYMEVVLVGSFVLLNIPKGVLKMDLLGYVLIFSFVAHYLTTDDKVTTTILMIMTLLLYEVLKKTNLDVKWPMVTVFMVFFVSYIMSWSDMLASLTTTHVGRSDLYKGIFQNANSNGGFSLFTFFFAFIFCKDKTIRYIMLVLTFSSIVASGSRNAMLSCLLFFAFLFIQRTKFKKFAFSAFITFLLLSFFYLFFVEMNSDVDFTVMGKEANSAGRSEQIAMVVATYPLSLFGSGKDLVDNFVNDLTGFAVHNFYVSSLYSMGIIILVGYMLYVHKLYKNTMSSKAKAALLASNIYFFFEPGISFYLQMLNVYPIMVVIMQMNQEKYIKKS